MWWPKEGDHCWYTGWYIEMMYFWVDLSVTLRECIVGVHDYLVDSGSFACSSGGGGSIVEAYYRPLTKLARYVEGRYDMSWDSCQDYENFKMHTKEVKSIKDAFKDIQDDANDEMHAE